MGFKTRNYVVAQCDHCKVLFEGEGGGIECFKDKEKAKKIVESCDWKMKNGKLQCASCWEN